MSSLSQLILHPFSLLPSFLRPTRIGPRRSLLLGLILGFSFSLSLAQLASYVRERYKKRYLSRPGREEGEGKVEIRKERVVEGVEGLIGMSLSFACIQYELVKEEVLMYLTNVQGTHH